MKRVMCVYFPAWPIQRLLHARPELRERAVAIAQPSTRRGAVVRLCCPRALRAGVRADMPIAEARAIAPFLSIHDEEPSCDLRALEKLAAWAERFSPIVGLEEGPAPECLLLDVTGCASYFAGEDRLAQRAVEEFRVQGWSVRVAIADTIGAAWAVCHRSPHAPREELRHAERDGYVVPFGNTESAVRSQPIAGLRLPNEALELLTTLGFERIEQLLEMPRDLLAGRIDALVLRRLDQMLGRVPEPIVPCKFRPDVQARCSFEYATDRRVFLDHALDQLLQRIVAMLREQGRGAKHLECWFFHESAPPSRVDVRLFRATQEIVHLRKLLDARMERLQLPEPACGIYLRAPVVEPLAQRQYDLFDTEPPCEEELAALIDRLVSRLGHEAVTFATLVDDPQPEFAYRLDPAINEKRATRGVKNKNQGKRNGGGALLFDTQYSVLGTPHSVLGVRPASLAHPAPIIPLAWTADGTPARFRHAGKEHAVVFSWGPERIETGWWRGDDVRRDYYIVETENGTRWWIFRRHDGQWFVQGCFD